MSKEFPMDLLSLPALSIRQPWAASVLYLGKDVENRNWPTRYRGRFLIHAAKGMTNDEVDAWWDFARLVEPNFKEILKAKGLEGWRDLPRGGIVGMAELVDCVSSHQSEWFVGRFGFLIRNAEPLPFFPCKGALGFFRVGGTA